MFQTRSLSTGFLVASLGLAAGLAVFTSSDVRAGGTPCTGDLSDPALKSVKAACGTGGKEAAKKAMKGLMDKANADKAGLKCESCHADGGPDYKTKADALEKFKKDLSKHDK